MPKPSANGTVVYQRQHSRGLTLPQLNAVDLLVTGKTDKETAELLNLHRTTVTKWRLYDPVFQAALNVRRAEVWSAGVSRLQALIPKALDVLSGEMEKPDGPNRLKAAVELLRLVPLSLPAAGPADPEEIIRQVVVGRRAQARGTLDDVLEDGKGLPPFDEQVQETWRELEARVGEPDPEDHPVSKPPATKGKVCAAG
jgi:hypothetical protein